MSYVVDTKSEHREIVINIGGDSVPVDEHVADLVLLMNRIPSLTTISSCQGDPGEIPGDGVYGHVAFRYGSGWEDLCYFCFAILRPLFLKFIDDEIRLDIFANSDPWAWINFRPEILPILKGRLSQLEGVGDERKG